MTFKAIGFLAIIIGLTSCATFRSEPPTYSFKVKDEPENHRFVFEFISDDDRALCVSADAWPTVSDAAVSGITEVVTRQGVIKAPKIYETDAGMICGRSDNPDCGTIRVAPHARLETRLNYTLFGDTDVLTKDDTKHFVLHPNYPFVRVCGKV